MYICRKNTRTAKTQTVMDNEQHISRRQALRRLFAAGTGLALAGKVVIADNTPPHAAPYAFAAAGDSKIISRTWNSLGDTVGLLGLGCMRLPREGNAKGRRAPISQEKTNMMVDYAIAHGINYFDTASGYPGSEEAMGKALCRHPRESYMVATKLSNQRSSEKTLENAREIFNNSLKALKLDYVDFYLLHSLSGPDDMERRYISNGVLDWLIEQKKQGRIRHIGFSYHGDNASFPKLLDNYYKWEFVQIQLNYLDWEYMESWAKVDCDARTLYAEAARRNIPVTIMEPIRGGALANVNKGIRARLAERFPSLSPAGVALTYASSFPNVLCTLSGMSNMEQLMENVETFSRFKAFNEEDNAFLMTVAHLYRANTHIPCTACRYCMPCPSGVDIPGNFAVYNTTSDELNIPDPRDKGSREYRKQKKALLSRYRTLDKSAQAEACIKCNACVPKCPQHIRIPDKMAMLTRLIHAL